MIHFLHANMLAVTKNQLGFSYLAVLFFMAVIALSLAVTSQHDATMQLREKERDWVFIGLQYQQAIKSYYENSPDGIKRLPKTIDDLVLDRRTLKPLRHLRKNYLDPLTGAEWQLVRDEENFIVGVYSASQTEILSKNLLKDFANEQPPVIHADVKFIAKLDSKKQSDEENEEDENTVESDDENAQSASEGAPESE